jgi:hypothetical protein
VKVSAPREIADAAMPPKTAIIFAPDAPSILNASYRFVAEIEVPAGGAEGMLITQGGRFGGYG